MQKWTPVYDKLPPRGDLVILTVVDDHGDTPYTFVTVGWLCLDDYEYANIWISDNEIVMGDVVAWRPMPEPYQEIRDCTTCKHACENHECWERKE